MKLIDLYDFINKFEEKYASINKKYIDKITGLEKEKDNVIANAGKQSEKFVKDTIDKINIEIAKTEDAMNKKLHDLDEQIKTWIDGQKDKIEKNVINSAKARLGIDTTVIDK